VIYHTATQEELFGLSFQVLRPVHWFGYAGVDLFFVLSGFIITMIGRKDLGRPERLGPFVLRRLWRIYPPYWAALALTFGLWALIAPSLLYSCTAGELIETAALLPPMPRLLPIAWSLSYELLFYGVFAGLILLPRRVGGPVLTLWFLLVV